ncbi:MAG: putative hydro-lyase [Erythrobacter sp.]
MEKFRSVLRRNAYAGHTAGLCPGLLQTNLVILPKKYALDFETYCRLNPKPCPLIARTDVGALSFDSFDHNLDLRYDLPKFRTYSKGEFTTELRDISGLWQNNFVSFALGCSFSFENALQQSGISVRHIDENKTVPMYRTNLTTSRAGIFHGPVVVSMRPIPRDRVEQTIAICDTFPHAHGAPLHVGDPTAIGISDICQPEWGESVKVHEGDVPVFWACGVTTHLALSHAKPDVAITHAPGAMLILSMSDTGAAET